MPTAKITLTLSPQEFEVVKAALEVAGNLRRTDYDMSKLQTLYCEALRERNLSGATQMANQLHHSITAG